MSIAYLQIHTNQLQKTWRFYSCLGIVWDEHDDEEPVSETPTLYPYGWMAKKYRVPEYSGVLGMLKINFFYGESPEYISPNAQRFLFVHCEFQEEVKDIAQSLKGAGFAVTPDLENGWDGEQKDPDGRLVYISIPPIGEVLKAHLDENEAGQKQT